MTFWDFRRSWFITMSGMVGQLTRPECTAKIMAQTSNNTLNQVNCIGRFETKWYWTIPDN